MSRKRRIVGVDFETEGIDARPKYPPRPVGLAILDGNRRKYWSWGHPTENNCTMDDARAALSKLYADPTAQLAYHNGKFDTEVAEVHMGLALPDPERVEDSLILAFLDDPYAKNLSLKPLAERLLGEPPTEQEAVRDWLIENHAPARTAKKQWGRYICEAPGGVVSPYAIGDVERTVRLVELLGEKIRTAGMHEAYSRELRLNPVLIDSEKRGVAVDVVGLERDAALYGSALEKLDRWIAKRVGRPDLVVDERDALADAIESAGLAGNGWGLTATGKRSTSRDSLNNALTDELLAASLAYRGSLATCLRTFMTPWLAMAREGGGKIHTTWHATRGAEEHGARTGRLSSTPNLQNIPVEFEDEARIFEETKFFDWLKALKLPPLPQMRSYIVASGKNRILCGRDYNSQELRVLAHYEDGALADQYRKDPRLDVHRFVADMIVERFGTNLGPNPRKTAKTLNFLKVYGGGVAKLAMKLKISMDKAQQIMRAYEGVLPGLKALNREMRGREKMNEPIRTLGGRLYHAEPPRVIDGVTRTFGYKLLNYLVQGSSADMTKEAAIRYAAGAEDSHLLMTVHDEIVIDAPKKGWKCEMSKLKEAMESIALDVPLLSDGEVGDRWTEMRECA